MDNWICSWLTRSVLWTSCGTNRPSSGFSIACRRSAAMYGSIPAEGVHRTHCPTSRTALPSRSLTTCWPLVDHLGYAQVAVLGLAVPSTILCAASHPERTRAMALFNTTARMRQADDYPFGAPADTIVGAPDLRRDWGSGSRLDLLAPPGSVPHPCWPRRGSGTPPTNLETNLTPRGVRIDDR
jgi:hypothetical protein